MVPNLTELCCFQTIICGFEILQNPLIEEAPSEEEEGEKGGTSHPPREAWEGELRPWPSAW